MKRWLPVTLLLSLLSALAIAQERTLFEGNVDGRLRLSIVDDSTAAPPPDTTIPPPDPQPEPSPGCHDGFVDCGGWWSGWCGDEFRNFTTAGDYGAMRTNAEGLRWLSDSEGWAVGWIEIEVYFATDRVPQGTGGLHILSPNSGHRALGTPRTADGYPGWLRPDFQIRPDGTNTTAELQIGTYNLDGQGKKWFEKSPGNLDHVVDVWRTGITLRPKVWQKFRFEWRRSGEQITYNLNGKTRTVRIHRDSQNIAAIAVGNMDGLVANGQSVFGGSPEVRYRNLRQGRL